MIESEKQAFCEVVAAMAVVHGRAADGPLYAGWWMAMRDWSLKDFQDAAHVVMKTAKYMPTPSMFHELKLAGQKTSGEAWEHALARSVLWRSGQRWNDRIERAARAVGGWQAIAMADTETALPHLERRFKVAYDELSDVEETRAALPNIAADPDAPRLEDQTRPARLTRGA